VLDVWNYSELGQQDKAGAVRVDGASFVEKVVGSLQAVQDDPWLFENLDVDDVV
jgi:hypothetical protein